MTLVNLLEYIILSIAIYVPLFLVLCVADTETKISHYNPNQTQIDTFLATLPAKQFRWFLHKKTALYRVRNDRVLSSAIILGYAGISLGVYIWNLPNISGFHSIYLLGYFLGVYLVCRGWHFADTLGHD